MINFAGLGEMPPQITKAAHDLAHAVKRVECARKPRGFERGEARDRWPDPTDPIEREMRCCGLHSGRAFRVEVQDDRSVDATFAVGTHAVDTLREGAVYAQRISAGDDRKGGRSNDKIKVENLVVKYYKGKIKFKK